MQFEWRPISLFSLEWRLSHFILIRKLYEETRSIKKEIVWICNIWGFVYCFRVSWKLAALNECWKRTKIGTGFNLMSEYHIITFPNLLKVQLVEKQCSFFSSLDELITENVSGSVSSTSDLPHQSILHFSHFRLYDLGNRVHLLLK